MYAGRKPPPEVDGQGFTRVPRGGRRSYLSAARAAMESAPDETLRQQPPPQQQQPQQPPQQPIQHSTEGSAAKKHLQDTLRRVESSMRLLGEDAPPAIAAQLTAKADMLREQLRDTAPVAQRLLALQQGVERRKERASKLDSKIAELRTQQNNLATQMEAALQKVRDDFSAQEQRIRMEIIATQRQKEQDAEAVQELREKQRELVPAGESDDAADNPDTFSAEQFS
eukprot:746781-Amphidinium_carterae.1